MLMGREEKVSEPPNTVCMFHVFLYYQVPSKSRKTSGWDLTAAEPPLIAYLSLLLDSDCIVSISTTWL